MLNNWPGSPRQHIPQDCLSETSKDSIITGPDLDPYWQQQEQPRWQQRPWAEGKGVVNTRGVVGSWLLYLGSALWHLHKQYLSNET